MIVCEEVEIGSTQWLELRKKSITSSDVAVLLGCAYGGKTPRKLWREKMGLDAPVQMNAKMARGQEMEPHVRSDLEKALGIALEPKIVMHPLIDYFMTTVDGISEDGSTVVEIKVGDGAHGQHLAGKIPDYYKAQIQHHLFVTGAKKLYYTTNEPYGLSQKTTIVERDEQLISFIEERGRWFWPYLRDGVEPPEEQHDFVSIDLDEQEFYSIKKWIDAKRSLQLAEELEKACREMVLDMTDDGDCLLKHEGKTIIKVTRVERAGAVDWKAVCKKWGITDDDLKTFRKDAIGYPKLEVC